MTQLSILIRSLENRQQKLDHLLRSLYIQILALEPNKAAQVEILTDIDNKEVTSGMKANRLLDKARGKYVRFIDDDDHIYSHYVELILQGCASDADCIATSGHYSQDGGVKKLWKLSKDYHDHDAFDGEQIVLFRRANHLTPIKREYAIKARFPDLSKAEDKEYSARVNQYLKTEYKIDKPLYHYDYSSSNKEY